jgi:hypothetical protein
MRTFTTTLLILFSQSLIVLGQPDSLKIIDVEVDKIDATLDLTTKEFDAGEIYGHGFEGGGWIKVYLDGNETKKIDQQFGLSFGRIRTTIYFANGKPIKIIDSEENFIFSSDQTSINYSKGLTQVLEATIYIFNWNLDRNQTIIKAKRNLSDGPRAVSEYERTIDIAKKLVNKK